MDDTILKEGLKAVADSEAIVSDLVGGWHLGELSDLVAAAEDLPALVKDANQVLPTWESLDDAGRADLVAYVQANCKFPANVSVESYTQKALEALVLVSQIYQVFAPAAPAAS